MISAVAREHPQRLPHLVEPTDPKARRSGAKEGADLSARLVVERRRRIAEVDSGARVFPAPLFVAPFVPSLALMMFTPLAAITPIVVVSLGRSNTCNADDSDR